MRNISESTRDSYDGPAPPMALVAGLLSEAGVKFKPDGWGKIAAGPFSAMPKRLGRIELREEMRVLVRGGGFRVYGYMYSGGSPLGSYHASAAGEGGAIESVILDPSK